MKKLATILLLVAWCGLIKLSATQEVTTATRQNRELETALQDLFEESDFEHGEEEARHLIAQKREERKVLKELYYLVKVLQAFRRPNAYGSTVFKSVIDRITSKELVELLERKLRREKGFEVISRIGMNGTVVPDPLQFQLANDYRVLAPVLVRTLRRVLSLKNVPEVLQVDEKNNYLYELQWDVQNEWMSLREAANNLQGDGVGLVQPVELHRNTEYLGTAVAPDEVYEKPIPVVPEGSNAEFVDTGADDWTKNPIAGGYQWARHVAATPEELENRSWEIEERRNSPRLPDPPPQPPVVIIQQSTTKISEKPAPAPPVRPLPPKVRPFPVVVSAPAPALATQLSVEVDRVTREMIAVELDKFLLQVEDLSGVDGFAKEFDRSDRARMVGWVKQFYAPTIGLDQRELARALRRLLKTKQLRRGRPDVVGGPCGYHGSYTFFKGVKISFGHKGAHDSGASSAASQPASAPGSGSVGGGPHHYRPLVLALGDCIPVRPWSDSPIACLAELRMVWRDRNEQCLLIALRLYFLPENTPSGRNCHGERTPT
uniref:Uncharacterized protein n=1 Tax=Anopheles melas TaxID=34690 RepID=A0A182U042_9DIPT